MAINPLFWYKVPMPNTALKSANAKSRSYLTPRAILIGTIGLIAITASSMYVALRMGALPWPTVFVTVLSMAILKKAKGSTLEEINCTHTLMSSGAMVAGGLAFTLPGLWMRDPSASLSLFTIIIIAVTGALLGTLFTTMYRPEMIERERLPYPIGEASYNTLKAGKEGKKAPLLFTSLGLSSVFTFLRDLFGIIPSNITIFSKTALFPSLTMWVSPMALAIGSIIGPTLALLWFLGSVIGYYTITPIGLITGFFKNMGEADLFRSNMGLGLMIGTGLAIAITGIAKIIKNLAKLKSKKTKTNKKALILVFAVCFLSWTLLTLFTEIGPIEALFTILLTYIAAYLSGMLTGQTGINPMEVFAILVMMFIALPLKSSLAASFSIAGVVAVACGLVGDVMNDLKSGSMVGTPYKDQILAEGIGGVIGAIVASLSLIYLKNAFGGFGSEMLPAPQAAAVSSMTGGISDIGAFLMGILIALLMFVLRIPGATFGLGFYLPVNISSIMAVGAIIMIIIKRTMPKRDFMPYLASGLLGGEGIAGVISAFISMAI